MGTFQIQGQVENPGVFPEGGGGFKEFSGGVKRFPQGFELEIPGKRFPRYETKNIPGGKITPRFIKPQNNVAQF